jgi:hypothetical protein
MRLKKLNDYSHGIVKIGRNEINVQKRFDEILENTFHKYYFPKV